MVLDATSIELILLIGGCIGFASTFLADSIGKAIAAFATFPTIMFLLGLTSSVMQITNPSQLGPWMIAVLNGLIPLAISGAGEGAGVTIAASIKKAFNL